MNQTEPLLRACTLYRIPTIAKNTFNVASVVIGTLEGVYKCEWIGQRLSEPHARALQDLLNCRT